MKTGFARQRIYTRSRGTNTFGDFVCIHCGAFVSADAALSGVRNRNHCPYCLSSRHLDQFEPGDRLSACKARMRPAGLMFKRTAKKYPGAGQGELMLIHLCEDCGRISMNRIAADDDDRAILALLEARACDLILQDGIAPLGAGQLQRVRQCLFGRD